MNLKEYAKAMRVLSEEDLDFSDLYVIAEYQRAKEEGDVTIMSLTKNALLSKTVMHRRIKSLVQKNVFEKTDTNNDMRIRVLVDGPRMGQIVEYLSAI
jgi:predicted HTH transcriptional regulator